MELYQYVFVYFVVILGSICQGSISMGFGLIAAPILILINPSFVPAPMIMCGLSLSVLVMIRNRKSSDFSALKFSLLGRFMGTLIAVSVIYYISGELFSLVFGSIIIIAVLLSMVKASWSLTPSKLFSAGVVSGIMATLTSIGSPPMGLLYQNQKGSVLRGTLSGFFTVGASISLISLWFVGKVAFHEFSLFIRVFPALLIGFWLSKFTIRILDKGYTRPLILVISGVSGLAVIIKTMIKFM